MANLPGKRFGTRHSFFRLHIHVEDRMHTISMKLTIQVDDIVHVETSFGVEKSAGKEHLVWIEGPGVERNCRARRERVYAPILIEDCA